MGNDNKINYRTNEKSAFGAENSGVSNVVRNSGLSTYSQYSRPQNLVKSLAADNQKALEVRGIEPPDSWLTDPSPRQVTPRAFLLYHNEKENCCRSVARANHGVDLFALLSLFTHSFAQKELSSL